MMTKKKSKKNLKNPLPSQPPVPQLELLLSKFSCVIWKHGRPEFSVSYVIATRSVGKSINVCYGNICLIIPVKFLKS